MTEYEKNQKRREELAAKIAYHEDLVKKYKNELRTLIYKGDKK